MKKSEALKTLGLADGATDDEVKQAHRKLVIAHHPDKFALGSKERDEAEELTKLINEARDVLLGRSWTPEFDPRRDPRPYANPYAHPTSDPFGAPARDGSVPDPFAGWPFGQDGGQGQGQRGQGAGRTTYVWTSWDGAHTTAGGGAGGWQPPGADPFDAFNPFDPFAPFRTSEPQQTPQQVRAETARLLKREAGAIALKLAALAVLAAAGSLATGLFVYVVVSVVHGLWKRFGSCLVVLALPLLLVLAPLVFVIAPRQGGITVGLAVASFVALLFDVVNVRDLVRTYRAAKRAADS